MVLRYEGVGGQNHLNTTLRNMWMIPYTSKFLVYLKKSNNMHGFRWFFKYTSIWSLLSHFKQISTFEVYLALLSVPYEKFDENQKKGRKKVFSTLKEDWILKIHPVSRNLSLRITLRKGLATNFMKLYKM